MRIQSKILLSSAFVLFALTGCDDKKSEASASAVASGSASASASASAENEVAATVNGTPIRKKQLDQIMMQQAAQGMPDTPDTRKMVIENLALQLLASQEAAKKGLDKSPEVAESLEMSRQSLLANAFVRDFINTNKVSDTDLKAEYEKFKTTQGGNEFKARHILVSSEAEAKDIIAKLKKDINAFNGLAKSKSKDPGSKDRGGDLGWFDPRSMVPEFGAAVAKLTKGKFTEEPVKSQYGFHVIVLDDSRPLTVPGFDDVKAGLTQQLQQQNLKKLLDDLKAKAKIDIVAAPASAPKANAEAAPASASSSASAPTASK